MIGFSNETEMEDAYIVAQAKNLQLSVIAIVFERYKKTDTIKYKIRHSEEIPYTLYQNVPGEHMRTSPTIYFDIIPIMQVQMCVDRALINQIAPNSMSNIKVKLLIKEYVIYFYVLGHLHCI